MERKNAFRPLIILILALAGPAQAQYAGGSGEPSDPYLITTPEQMNAIGANPNDWDKHFKLMADLDLSQYTGTEFNLIGTEVPILVGTRPPRVENVLIPFTGTFDGGGHTITNFTYICSDIDKVGLFGYVADPNAQIDNLEIIAPFLYVEDAAAVGSLVGRCENGAIVNCHINEAFILAESVSYAGALAGNVTGGSVASCGSNCSIVVSEDGPYGSEWYVGGLIGCLREGTLMDCYVDGGLTGGDSSAGGLLGANFGGTVDSCWATVTVTGEVDVGGLVGTNIGIVRNAYASGDVWGDTRIGGLVGNNTGTRGRGRGLGVSGQGEIALCYATGTVVGEEFVGGLVGAGSGPITECFATGDAKGDRAVGGLVGYSDWETIFACHARGTVIGDEMVGGLIGVAGGQCTVRACYATGNVQGGETVGGLVGENTANITACYATGRVTAEAAVGGLCGSIKWNGQAGGCFWDIEASGQDTSAGGMGLTTGEMQTAETFLEAGWDFVGEVENGTEEIWWIDEGRDYPRLWWEGADTEF